MQTLRLILALAVLTPNTSAIADEGQTVFRYYDCAQRAVEDVPVDMRIGSEQLMSRAKRSTTYLKGADVRVYWRGDLETAEVEIGTERFSIQDLQKTILFEVNELELGDLRVRDLGLPISAVDICPSSASPKGENQICLRFGHLSEVHFGRDVIVSLVSSLLGFEKSPGGSDVGLHDQIISRLSPDWKTMELHLVETEAGLAVDDGSNLLVGILDIDGMGQFRGIRGIRRFRVESQKDESDVLQSLGCLRPKL